MAIASARAVKAAARAALSMAAGALGLLAQRRARKSRSEMANEGSQEYGSTC
jgi:hypothetical protein